LSLEPPWKKPLIVAAGCLGFLLFLAAVIFTAKRVVKRLRRSPAPEEGEIQQSQAKDDSSLVVFEIGTPSTPDKLIKS
jgi:O-antigen ligase